MDKNDETTRSVFDDLTAQPAANETGLASEEPVEAGPLSPVTGEIVGTPLRIKQTAQELLRLGVLYKTAKPNLYQIAVTNREAVNGVLEPLDLTMRFDDVRGLVLAAVAHSVEGEGSDPPDDGKDRDEWSHPLVRRQRLTLEQSLLVAILRRHYVDYEKTGTSVAPPRVAVDELVPELQPYLGDKGSDAGEQSRVRRLLEQLKDYGIVSLIGEDDLVTIRPLICHLADPDSLQTLLHHYEALAARAPEIPADE